MAKTNPARSPKRIRRWLQTTAVGSVLLSSSLFGLIAVQGATATPNATDPALPAATPWDWPSAHNTPAVAPATAPPAVQFTPASATPATTIVPSPTRTVVATGTPVAASTVVATNTAQPTSTPAKATPTVRARTRAS
jgi:hypothetical protein